MTPLALATATIVYEHLVGEAIGVSARRLARSVKRLRKAKRGPAEITEQAADAAVVDTRTACAKPSASSYTLRYSPQSTPISRSTH